MLSLQLIYWENKEPGIWKKTPNNQTTQEIQKNTQQFIMATNLYAVAPSQMELLRH